MTTITHAKDNFPTDIPAGPDQTPVQPKIKFPVTQKGNKCQSFHSEWYRLSLEYSKELHTVMHVVFLLQNLGSIGKPL